MKNILNENIQVLNLDKAINSKLISNQIDTVFKLCYCSRMGLSELDFTNEQINKIIVNLQLVGLDLKKNHAKRNTLVDSII